VIGFELLRPSLGWLLLLAPLSLWVGWGGLRRARAELALWVAERMRGRFLPGRSRTRAGLRLGSGAAAAFLLALALLGPVRGHTYRAVAQKGLDLVVCLDTSRSMLAQDLRPSRFERARREVVGLLDRLRGDRVALIAFAGDARDVAPLTRDRQTLEGLLGFVSPEDNRAGGTDLAAAIEHALAMFDGRTGAHEAIVLLTDGEDLAGKAGSQVEEARKRGIRIFVVGVGTEAGGKIPVLEQGRPAFLRDPEGNEVVTRLEGQSLVALARATGGEYLSAEQSPTPLEDLYAARIQRIEGREIEGGERRVPYDRFQWPLALAFFFLVLEFAIPARTRAPGARRGTAPALALLVLAGTDGADPRAVLAEAVRHHREQRSSEAEAALRGLLEGDEAAALAEGEVARAHFALGVVLATRARASSDEAVAAPAREDARRSFSSARALAGAGALRLDATYDLGAVELEQAERVRARIPEVSGGAPSPLAPALAPAALPPGGPGPDPLPEARALYLAARAWLVERLRLDWRDEDTRANLELIHRRLRELEDIEQRREQQKEQQQDQPKGQQEDQQEDQQEEQGSDSESPATDSPDDEAGGKQPEDGKQSEERPPEGAEREDPKDGEPPPEPGGEEAPEPAGPQPEEGEPPAGDPAREEPRGEPAPQAERVLTREEVMQLLDKLAELEKRQRALDAASRARSRARTARDW
jgi:Ca-activated chloride channel family protein